MRDSSPSSTESAAALTTRGLVLAGTGALLLVVIILVTGGFVIDAWPLHFSARRWPAPLAVAAAGWGLATLRGRQETAAAAVQLETLVDRHAPALALILAAAAAGTGIGYGTYAASGSDASGYISEAAALTSGHLALDEPLAREVGVPNATWTFAPLGYRPGRTAGELVPTYPPGLPLTMAAAAYLDTSAGPPAGAGTLAPFLVVPFLGGLAVFCTYLLGAELHSRATGLVAAALLVTSPIFLFQVVQPMSDVAATAWWALALVFALSRVPAGALAAGATAGLAVLTRPNLAPLVIPVGVAAIAWMAPRRPSAGAVFSQAAPSPRAAAYCWSRLWPFLTGLAPAAGALLLVQWRLYGAPFASGYGSSDTLFSLANTAPNARGYALRIVQGEPAALALFLIALVALVVSRGTWKAHSTTPPDGHALRPAVLLASTVGAVVLVSYLPYGVFAEWWYLRFLLPAWPLAFVAIGATLLTGLAVIPAAARGIVLMVVVTAACSANVIVAEREQAFNLRDYEARYRVAGLYLASALPPNAVVLAVQHSGSVHHYTGLPVARWDLLGADIDAVTAALRRAGRHPVLVVDDWEAPDLRSRFPHSQLAQLRWTPRAEVLGTTRVWLYDAEDMTPGRQPASTDHLR